MRLSEGELLVHEFGPQFGRVDDLANKIEGHVVDHVVLVVDAHRSDFTLAALHLLRARVAFEAVLPLRRIIHGAIRFSLQSQREGVYRTQRFRIPA